MPDLPSLVSEYMDFRAARGFQPNHKVERLLDQFVATVPPPEDGDSPLFTNAQVLAGPTCRPPRHPRGGPTGSARSGSSRPT